MLLNYGKDAYLARITVSNILKNLIDNLDWVVEMENKGDKAEWLKGRSHKTGLTSRPTGTPPHPRWWEVLGGVC